MQGLLSFIRNIFFSIFLLQLLLYDYFYCHLKGRGEKICVIKATYHT